MTVSENAIEGQYRVTAGLMVRTYIDPLVPLLLVFVPLFLFMTIFFDYQNDNIRWEFLFEDIISSLFNTFYILLPAIIISPLFIFIIYSSAVIYTLRGLRPQQRQVAVQFTADGVSWKNAEGGVIFSPWRGIQGIKKKGTAYRFVVKTGCYPGIRIFVPASIFDEKQFTSILALVRKGA